jgi:exopolyphosphatase / guanosine-5'-triphosphate,3'-diphosphate pyrophosphatase
VRLVVAEVLPSGGYRVLDEERENTRLAAHLAKTGRLDPAAADATIGVLRHFLSIANGYGATQIRAIGTSALRDAEDSPEFCARVRKDFKLSIEVISAAEEARLAFLSVARAFRGERWPSRTLVAEARRSCSRRAGSSIRCTARGWGRCGLRSGVR